MKDRVIFPLPLDVYQLAPLDQLTVDRAESKAEQSCLKRFGFDAHWPEYVPTGDRAQPGYRAGEFGINVAGDVDRYGYQSPPDPADGARDEAKQEAQQYPQVMWTIDDGTRSGDYGGVKVPDGGCLGESRRALYGNQSTTIAGDNFDPNGLDPAQQLHSDSWDRALQDVRLRGAFVTWSRCMAAQGYRYSTPLQPTNAKVGVVSPADIVMARTDLACRIKQNLIGLWYAVTVAYEKQTIEKYAAQLTEIKSRNEALLRKAADVLGR